MLVKGATGGHLWDRQMGTLSISQVTATNVFEDQVQVDLI